MTEKVNEEEKFEKVLENLQSIVRDLESGDCSLEESIQKFEKGVAMAKSCQQRLNEAERKIEKLIKVDGDEIKTEPFDEVE